MTTKLVLTWFLITVIILIGGFYEVEYGRTSIRWHIFTGWIFIGIIVALYRIW